MKNLNQKLFSQSGLYSIGNIFQQIVNFFLIPVYTAFLGTYEYGIIGLMSMTAGIILQITKTPVAHGFVRYYFQKNNQKKELLFSSLIFALINSGIFFLIFFIFRINLSEIILDSTNYDNIILIYSFIILLQPIEDISQDLVKVQKKAGLYLFHQILNIITSTGLILYLLYSDYGVMAMIWGNLYITVFPGIFFTPLMLKNLKIKFSFNAIKPLLKYGYPMIPASISVVLLQMIDHYILKYFHGIGVTGLYTFGYKFGGLIGFLIIVPVSNILHPMLLELEKDKDSLQKFYNNTVHYIYYISLIACLVLSVFAKEVIMLMSSSKEFYPAWKFIPIIAFAYVHYGLSEMLGKGIILSKRTLYMSLSVVSAAIINIILNLILIPEFEVYGAAFATLLSFISLDIINYVFSKKLYFIRVKFIKIYFSSFILIIFTGISYLFSNYNIYLSIILKLLLVISFTIIIFVFLSKSNKENILKLIKRAK